MSFLCRTFPGRPGRGLFSVKTDRAMRLDADFRTVLKCLRVLRDEDIRERDRLYLLKQWFFRGQDVPGGLEKFIGFTFGECREPSEQPRMMDFEQDADAIYASFLMAYGMDLTEIPFLHWYKFLVLLRLLGEDTPLEKRIALRGMDTSKLKGEARIRAERAQQAVALREPASAREEAMRQEITRALEEGKNPSEIIRRMGGDEDAG